LITGYQRLRVGTVAREIYYFIIFSNLFIATCAVLMVRSPLHLFHITKPFDNFGWFVFFSTLASYNFHWYLTDPAEERTLLRSQWLARFKPLHLVVAIITSIVSLIFLVQFAEHWKMILPVIFFTLLYTAPKLPFTIFDPFRQMIIGKTILLTAVWTYVTSVLPLWMYAGEWRPGFTAFTCYRFTLIFAICILFDIRDKDFDKRTGIKSLVTLLSSHKIRLVFNLTLILNLVSAIALLPAGFQPWQIIILLIPSIITFLLYPKAIKSADAILFYLTLDGLMTLAPFLFLIIEIFS